MDNFKDKIVGLVIWALIIGGIVFYFSANDEDKKPTVSGSRFEVNNSDNIYDDDETGDLYYNGYRCTQDCSGHDAGYNWAEENEIDDVDDCDGNSQSFIEGCISFVEDNY